MDEDIERYCYVSLIYQFNKYSLTSDLLSNTTHCPFRIAVTLKVKFIN